MGKFVKKIGKNDLHYFILKAGNGEIILSSEMYTTKAARDNGIESVRKNAPLDERYEKKQAGNGRYHFNLKASNGQIIGSSEMYASAASRDYGIGAVMRNAPDASVAEE